jgi:hypothetical protein
MKAPPPFTLRTVLRQTSQDVAAYRATAVAIEQPVVALQRGLAAAIAIALVLVTMVDPPERQASAVVAPSSGIAAR